MKKASDFFKELYKDDPEGYAKHLKDSEERAKEYQRKDLIERKKIAELFAKTTRADIHKVIDTSSKSDLRHLYSYLYGMANDVKRTYCKRVNETWDEIGLMTLDDLLKKRYEGRLLEYDVHVQMENENEKALENKLRLERKKVAELFTKFSRDDIQEGMERLSNEELLIQLFHINSLNESVQKKYYQLLDETIFSISKTTFKEVVMKHSWADVEKVLFAEYPDQVQSKNGYEYVFSELQRLDPEGNDESFVIVLSEVEEDDGSVYLSVGGKKPNDMDNYALDFSPWESWLGFYCNQENLETQGELEFIAHCLWEMTFDGFRQEDIQESANELVRRAEEVKEEIRNKKEE